MRAILPKSICLTAILILAACAEKEVILPGERLDPLAVTSPDGPAVIGGAPVTNTQLALAPTYVNDAWNQRAGNAAHQPGHVALRTQPQSIWSANIGQGNSKRQRIAADPVVGGGLIFTLDSQARVVATTTGGASAWSANVTPQGEGARSASGGGLAYDAGRVFVTSGYGELIALDARSGGVLWRQRVDSAIGSGPTVVNGTVYIVARDNVGWAVRAEDGKVLWQVNGTPSPAGVMGASSPSVQGNSVILPFSSGQLLAADTAAGGTLWSSQIAGRRLGRAIANIRDVTGDPVISGGLVYGGTSAGRINAVDLSSGETRWTTKEGANGPVVVAGGSVFAVNDQAELIRLDGATGAVIWRQALPYYTDQKSKRQDRIHAHYGPVLAGGRLIVASSDGLLRLFDPASGQLAGQVEVPGGAAAAPAIAAQTLYVVTRDGRLIAYR